MGATVFARHLQVGGFSSPLRFVGGIRVLVCYAWHVVDFQLLSCFEESGHILAKPCVFPYGSIYRNVLGFFGGRDPGFPRIYKEEDVCSRIDHQICTHFLWFCADLVSNSGIYSHGCTGIF